MSQWYKAICMKKKKKIKYDGFGKGEFLSWLRKNEKMWFGCILMLGLDLELN